MISFRSFSLEDSSDKVVSKPEEETEVEIFAKINNFDGLMKAKSSEQQVQVEARLGENNHCRVRKTIKNDVETFVYTFKIKKQDHSDQVAARRENNANVDEQFFEDFYSIADKCQTKTRYFFEAETISLSYRENDHDIEIQVPGVVYEVDVFTRPDGKVSEYCKIDIEVDKVLLFIEHNYPQIKDINMNFKISSLPFQPSNGIINDGNCETTRSFVAHLYETEYCTNLIEQRKGEKKNE